MLNKRLKSTVVLLLNLGSALAQAEEGPKVLSERKLLDLFQNGKGTSLQTESAKRATGALEGSRIEEVYQARVYSTFNLSHSNEKATTPYTPVVSPYDDWTIGIQKNLPFGIRPSFETFGSRRTLSSISLSDSSQMGIRLKAEMDLWKNLLGRSDRAQLNLADAKSTLAQLRFRIGQKQAETQLRKAYWSYVATERSIQLSQNLVVSAEKQLADAESRRKLGMTDNAEVARYRSQLESRKASRISFEYQREILLQTFELQWDNFRASEWTYDPAGDADVESKVLACIGQIEATPTPDMTKTLYDDWIDGLEQEKNAEISIANRHGDIDLALTGQIQYSGAGTQYPGANENLIDAGKAGYQIGLTLSIPIGTPKSRSEDFLLAAKSDGIESERRTVANQLRSTHETLTRAIKLITSGIDSQRENSKNLEINYREVLKKYQQGRVPVSTLVTEQDALFQSLLQEIETKKEVAHIVLSYFEVFSDFPCEWNQIVNPTSL